MFLLTHTRTCPKGVGYAMLVCSFGVGIYYNIIIAWCYYFVFASMQNPLPWAQCGHSWNNNKTCHVLVTRCPANATNSTLPPPTTMMPTATSNVTNVACIPLNATVTSPSEEYWK